MAPQPVIRYLMRDAIDSVKWDACIEAAPAGPVYAHTFYLDRMAGHWDALVLNDYEAVMPLPWKRKWGIRYGYRPFLTAQLGVIGMNLTPDLIQLFIAAIPPSYRLIEIPMNPANINGLPQDTYLLRTNYVLPLQGSYEEIESRYRENIRRNCKKAIQLGCEVRPDADPELVFQLAMEYMKGNKKGMTRDMVRFRDLYNELHQRGMTRTYGIFLKGRLLSGAIFILTKKRAYYILVGNHPDGRTVGASHLLIDSFLRDHAGQPLILDFEGSDIQNLAFFYSSFGAVEEPYPFLQINKLPRLLRWLKS